MYCIQPRLYQLCVYSRLFLPLRQTDGSVRTKSAANIRRGHGRFLGQAQEWGGVGPRGPSREANIVTTVTELQPDLL